MEDSRIKFLQRLLETPSPSGFEEPVQVLVREELKENAAEVTTDVLGNVVGALNPGGSPRVLLAGHCDEVGLLVRHISDDGYIYFAPIGGMNNHMLVGHRVIIHNPAGPCLGVLGWHRPHSGGGDSGNKLPEIHEMWIDIGARDKEEALKRVTVGDPVTFAAGFERLGEDYANSPGFDDKMGVFIILEAFRLIAKERPKAAVFAVSTVQEEVGCRGATAVAFDLKPDVGVAVDVWGSSDIPGADKIRAGDLCLGKGPILYRGSSFNPVLARLLVETAESNQIPCQKTACAGDSGTDVSAIQVSRAGVATAVVSIAMRYGHGPFSVLSLSDLENTSRLLAAFVCRLEPQMSFIPM